MAAISESKCPECGRKVSMLTSTGARVSRCPKCGAVLKANASLTGSTLGGDASPELFKSPTPEHPKATTGGKAPVTAKEGPTTEIATDRKATSTVARQSEKEVREKPASRPARVEKPPIAAEPVVEAEKDEKEEAVVELPKAAVVEEADTETVNPVTADRPEPELRGTRGESLDRLERFAAETLAQQAGSEETATDETPPGGGDDEPTSAEVTLSKEDKDLSVLAAELAGKEDESTETLSADLSRIVAQIDKLFGPGYASQHPQLITAALQAQQANSASADLVKRLERLDERVARLETLLKEEG
ncbi:hypothetical protein [Desulfuromonas sp. AOP6]|uniref:hypothetical protein n=1 Tax=Desulfuromonas sp. AOP6 TaxID=1566351 RepID=UPI001278034E|nr:hypothetical protein [Desulfuromonas sp. AOP6]BCA80668.1 hypothetical protein AOP6_2455 [Desulfuromonas sp. AOP6]